MEGDARAGYWGYDGRCDIPMRTAFRGLEDVINAEDPDFIIWTGDNIDHYIWFVNYENQFFNGRILKKHVVETLNYKKPIYPCLGNHEAFPTDFFDVKVHQWILRDFADIWKDYLTEEAYESLSRFGYYHMMHPNSNLRIISTWSLTFDNMNWYLIPNNTDPLGQLKFLEDTLKLSE